MNDIVDFETTVPLPTDDPRFPAIHDIDDADDLPHGWECTEDGQAVIPLKRWMDAGDACYADFPGDELFYDAILPGSKTEFLRETIIDLWTNEEIDVEFTLHPAMPDCETGHEHDFISPHSIVGGIEENPGVWGHGGGVIIHEVCRWCGTLRITDTWAQDPQTGEEGLRSIEIREYEHQDAAPIADA